MQRLIEGIVEFRERLLPEYAERFRELASGQEPDALFICCADSRVVPNLVMSSDPGELFVVRNVGNLIPPTASIAGDSAGDLAEASAIEYALLVLNVRNIIVCGHPECGAMKAALTGAQVPGTANLGKWLHHADAAVARLQRDGPLSPGRSPHDQVSQLNVLVQLENLMSYPCVRERLAGAVGGQPLRLWGWWFDIATGDMLVYEPQTRSFELLDRLKGDRLLAITNPSLTRPPSQQSGRGASAGRVPIVLSTTPKFTPC